ncbi:hypothetical protein SBA5_1150012 [Candidatus Sulfotelmatomonas gaucii]|uniref:Uncharacterized protein n=1 Tax=Candidatus Sulfuritelmatomonas gaucii TaxID=2043161 RepID=A0A2N9L3J5_9BACT|nr:hypothetical protein SBA5_1150012 [Candidatus Sulfotelmatomonas gaucii]
MSGPWSLAAAATRYRALLRHSHDLRRDGLSLPVMTRKLSKFKMPALPAAANNVQLPAETDEQT